MMLNYSGSLLFGNHDAHIKSEKPCLKEFLAFTALCLDITLLGHFAIFSKDLRMMITVIVESCRSLKVFLMIFYYTISSIAISSYTASSNDKDSSFQKAWYATYTQVFGENLEFNDVSKSWSGFINYMLMTNIVIIIFLNVLISIVSDNYARITGQMACTDSQFQARLLEDAENIRAVFKQKCKGHKQYLFTIKYQ